MKKRGYHHLILPDGLRVGQSIVLFDSNDSPISWHTFQHEEPFVEWVGGTFDLRNSSRTRHFLM